MNWFDRYTIYDANGNGCMFLISTIIVIVVIGLIIKKFIFG